MEATVEEIENIIIKLSREQLKQFRTWYEKFDSENWDKQIETDVSSGKLDVLASVAITEHKAGKTRKF